MHHCGLPAGCFKAEDDRGGEVCCAWWVQEGWGHAYVCVRCVLQAATSSLSTLNAPGSPPQTHMLDTHHPPCKRAHTTQLTATPHPLLMPCSRPVPRGPPGQGVWPASQVCAQPHPRPAGGCSAHGHVLGGVRLHQSCWHGSGWLMALTCLGFAILFAHHSPRTTEMTTNANSSCMVIVARGSLGRVRRALARPVYLVWQPRH